MSNTHDSANVLPDSEFAFPTPDAAIAAHFNAAALWDASEGPLPIGSVHAAIVDGDNLVEVDPPNPNAYVVVSDDGEWMVSNVTSRWHFVA